MKNFIATSLVFLCSCGNVILEPGVYKVKVTYGENNWGDKGSFEIDWYVVEKEENYTITFYGAEWKLTGKADSDSIKLNYYNDTINYVEGCDDYDKMILILFPKKDNNEKFTGNGYSEIHICNYKNFKDPSNPLEVYIWEHATFEGSLKED